MARRRRLLAIGTTIALVGAGASAGGASAAPNRGVHWGYTQVPDSAYTLQPGDIDLGAVPDEIVHFEGALKVRNADAAEALATAVSDPKNPLYGHFLSPAQYRKLFAPLDIGANLITAWQTGAGMQIAYNPANHLMIATAGTVKHADKAFETDIHNVAFTDPDTGDVTAIYELPLTPLYIPTAVVPFVEGFLEGTGSPAKHSTPQHIVDGAPSGAGTTTRHTSTAVQAASTSTPTATSSAPPDKGFRNATPCSTSFGEKLAPTPPLTSDFITPVPYATCGYKPAQLQGAYGIDSLLKQGIDGKGVTVAIVDAYASPTLASDVTTYAARNGGATWKPGQLTQSIPSSIRYGYSDPADGGDICGEQGWYGEETLDVEAVHTTAPGANVLYVGGSSCFDNDLLNSVNDIVDGHKADIITNSYGDAGEDPNPVDVIAEDNVFVQAAIEGIGVFFSSGDNGDEVDDLGTRTTDNPASSPWVTAVGGTALAVGAQNQYIGEVAWGTDKYTVSDDGKTFSPALTTPNHLYGGGGGTSQVFAEPGYQKGVVPDSLATYFGGAPGRVVPDISAVADPTTGMLVGQTQTFPEGVSYDEYRIGGTSLSSPLMAGMEALADQAAGHPHGFANPAIYQLKAGATTDIYAVPGRAGAIRSDFKNGTDASGGVVYSLRTFGDTESLSVLPGYDDATGVGTPIAPVFAKALGKKH